VGGALVRPDEDKSWSVKDASGQHFGNVGKVSRKDLRNAVEAARKALEGWRSKTGHNRAQVLRFMAENLDDRRWDIANRLSFLTGLSIEQVAQEIDLSIESLFWWAAYADRYAGTVSRVNGPMLVTTLYEPIGVIGIRAPDNPSLLGAVAPMAAAIAQGNTVVLLTGAMPIGALDLVPIVQSSDVPSGIINILAPQDPDAAALMLGRDYDEVASMWYCGTSVVTGKAIEEGSVHNLKRTWQVGGNAADWFGQGRHSPRYLLEATSPKAVWVPYGA
jgi:aldehyde dehydrogenase (NAD+)